MSVRKHWDRLVARFWPSRTIHPNPGSIPLPNDLSQQAFDLFRIYRARIVDEDQVTNHRTSWMLIFESALLAGFVYVAPKPLGLVLLVVGIVAAFLSAASIEAARHEIEALERRFAGLALTPEERVALPTIIGGGNRHQVGHYLPRLLPWMLVGLWIGAAIYVWLL